MINKVVDRRKDIYIILLVVLVVLQPILELVWFNNGTIPEVAGFTISTWIRFGLIGVIGLLSLSMMKSNKKNGLLLGYAVIVLVYSMLHLVLCRDFNSFVPGDFGYNLVSEVFYIIRMLLPIAMIYLVYNSKITFTIMKKTVVWISMFSSLLVVVTNILKISTGSYSNKTILGNFFDWFLNGDVYTFNDLASKGFFYSSIFSTVLVLIYPLIIYFYIKEKKKIYLFLIVIQGLALYMFGTKATTFSVVIELVLMTLIYLFLCFIKRDMKFSLRNGVALGVVLIIAIFILPYTPSLSRMSFDEEYKKAIDEEEIEEKEEWSNKKDLEKFFDENYPYFSVKEEFMLDSYPYKYDLEFWDELLGETGPSQRMQNRFIEQKMLERVKEINHDKMDTYFGLGYTRTSNIYNLERDFLYQFYSMGILGVAVFLGPYIAFLFLMIGYMLLHFKSKFNLLHCAIVLGVGLVCCLAYYSGNVMESLGITIVLGFLMGYLLKMDFEKSEDENEK